MKKLAVLYFLFLYLNVGAQKKQPNIIWITCEDISPYISAFGDELVQTPNLDALAADGIKYTSTYTVSGVCSPSRAGIITGMHPISIGAQHMRTRAVSAEYMPEGVPLYDAVLPSYVKAFPEFLRKEGYYTSNNMKEDYQFQEPVTVWDESSSAASYRNREADQPFFSVFNFFITHESQMMKEPDSLLISPDKVTSGIPGYYQDTPTVRRDIAVLVTLIETLDKQVGDLITQLKEDGVYKNSYIFFFSDHGGNLPWMKREVLERGTHIPLIVKLPGNEKAGQEVDNLISSIDFAPTVLSIAGIEPPDYLQGQPFLGDLPSTERKYVFAARDRMDDEYDRVRTVRDENFRYIYNYHPEKPRYQDIEYRKGIATMKEILMFKENDSLINPHLRAWFETPKPVEELYNVTADPEELHNLADDPEYREKLVELRKAFLNWTSKTGDLSYMNEEEMVISFMWNGQNEAPKTEPVEILQTESGVYLVAPTQGTSTGYRIIRNDQQVEFKEHIVQSWDAKAMFNRVVNGDKIKAPKSWKVYDGEYIQLEEGDQLEINAMRIGYQPYITTYIQKGER